MILCFFKFVFLQVTRNHNVKVHSGSNVHSFDYLLEKGERLGRSVGLETLPIFRSQLINFLR